MRKNIADRVTIAFCEIFYRKEAKYAILGQNYAILGQNTRYFDFPVEISVISEISINQKSLSCECGYFPNFRFFVRPLDKKWHDVPPPFDFLSLSALDIVMFLGGALKKRYLLFYSPIFSNGKEKTAKLKRLNLKTIRFDRKKVERHKVDLPFLISK